MKTRISDLPRELIEEILARVPMKFSRALVRLTCKNWNTLSKNQKSFAQMHIDKAARGHVESTMVALMDHNLYLLSVDVDHPSIKIQGKLSCLDEQVKISKVFHCEGLLLCVLKDDTRFVVWNPYCGETRWIKPRYAHRYKGLDMFSYALGYEDKKSGRSLKFLRFIDYSRNLDLWNINNKQFFWYEIYDFDTGLWTTLDVTPHWSISHCSHNVSLKGNTYWCAAERNGCTNRIICFDFTRERFGPLMHLPVKLHDYYPEFYWDICCVREEKLSAVCRTFDRCGDYSCYLRELEIWITTKIEAEEVLWSKFLKMVVIPSRELPNMINIYFIDEEKKVAMGYDYNCERFVIIGEAGSFRRLDHPVNCGTQGCHRWHLCSYVPSLVHIKKPAQGKRKKQNSLEKRQFAQNMLKLFEFEKLN